MQSISLQSRLPKTFPIKEIKQETEMVKTFTIDASLGAKPGQFVMAWIPGVDEIPLSVAFDDGKVTKLTFFAIGDATNELASKDVGDLVGLRGPFGTHYQWEPGQHLALVAGGYGAAPMFFVAHMAAEDDCALDVFVGARTKGNLLFLKEFEVLKNTMLHIATDDGSEGFKGYNVQLLEEILSEGTAKIDQVFACGPELMLKAVSDLTAKHNIPSQLSLERYMKCGYGLCGNCTVDPLGIRLCTEGPVVKNETCKKIEEFGKYHRDDVGRKHEF